MKTITLLMLIVVSAFSLFARVPTDTLPVKTWPSPAATPLVLYISGDGGFNSFTTNLCNNINKSGYAVAAVNSKAYFWDKKTPEKTSADITAYLSSELEGRSNQQLVMIGYSFGADVMPFIVNRLDPEMKKKLVSVVLISPSTSTDFEIHWSDMFGGNAKRSMDVVAEINKMAVPKLASFFGSDEKDFPVNQVDLKNYRNVTLPGGHRFDGKTEELAQSIIKEF